jgi:hypothetical protein
MEETSKQQEARREKILACGQDRLSKITGLYGKEPTTRTTISPSSIQSSRDGDISQGNLPSDSSTHQELRKDAGSLMDEQLYKELDQDGPSLSSFTDFQSTFSDAKNILPEPSILDRVRPCSVLIMAILSAIYAVYQLHKTGLEQFSWKILTDKHVAPIAPSTVSLRI